MLAFLRGLTKRLKETIFTVQGKVDVNFPETQKVEVLNPADIPDTVKVSNLDEVVKQLQTSVGEVTEILSKPQAKPEEIKPSLIKGLADVKKAIQSIDIPKTEFPDLSNEFDKVVSAVNAVELGVDFSEISASIEVLGKAVMSFDKYTRHNEVRVYINEKQVEKLAKATSVAVSGGIKNVDLHEGFDIPVYDYIALTYVAAGNGAGEVETAVFKSGGSGGSTVATLTLTYNASDEIATVTKT